MGPKFRGGVLNLRPKFGEGVIKRIYHDLILRYIAHISTGNCILQGYIYPHINVHLGG